MIRILIGDSHPIVRYGLRHLLTLEPDMEVVDEAAEGRSALNKVASLGPDVLLLDFDIHTMDGLTVLHVLHGSTIRPRVLMMTATENKAQMVEAMKLGCSGIVFKTAEPEQILEGIRRVYRGEVWLDPRLAAIVTREMNDPRQNGHSSARARSPLSKRELEVIRLTASGFRNKEIAAQLSISHQTIKNHLHNIFDKLGVTDRLELALYAIHSGIEVPNCNHNSAALQAKAG